MARRERRRERLRLVFGAVTSRVINLELHCHTVASLDGMMSYQSLLRTARAVGIDALAITDHDTIAGALEVRELVRRAEAPLEVIIGEERTLSDGSHLIGLFLERPIKSKDLREVIREIEGQGGVCLIPHPFRRKDGLLRGGLAPLEFFQERVGGFELFSAKCSYAENQRAAELLAGSRLGPFAGSDAHYECDLGESINEVEWQGDLRSSLVGMLKRDVACRLLGKRQQAADGERTYAPLYYRMRPYARVPQFLLPAAKKAYRNYRNWKFGIGRKELHEVYRHA